MLGAAKPNSLGAERDRCGGLVRLVRWMSDYYCAPLPRSLSLALPAPVRKGMREKRETFYGLAVSEEEAVAAAEAIRRRAPRGT